jgi:oligopeptidase B
LFEFTNPLITKIIYELDLDKGTLSVKQKTQYQGKQIDSSKFELKMSYAPTKDGEIIPITVLHSKNTKKDRKNKCLVLGYGAYGLNLELTYNSVYLEAVERGWVIAYCHIRGGNELGKKWHKEAILHKKAVSIDDFIACAYHLVQLGYTHPNYMAACGQSSGGGVVAQVINQEPSLFRAVILSHPFVDILSTLLDESLPLTVTDYNEYGNPLVDRNIYFSMLSYSPYENISNQEYPAILINMSEEDPRVPSFGILKYIEKLRKKAKEPSRLPNFYKENILVKIYKSGHFGPVENEEFIQHKIWEMMWLDKMLYEKNILNE